MKIIKVIKLATSENIELELDKIKDYERFSLYQVSRVIDGKKVPLYKECFSDFQLEKMLIAETENEKTFLYKY